jgi:hypothetical protein
VAENRCLSITIRFVGAFAVPIAFTTALLSLTLLPRLRAEEALTWSFWAAAALLLAWMAMLAYRARTNPLPGFTRAQPRAQHWVQGLCQLCVYAYWGWYWPPVYDFAPLLLGQLLFAYAFDILLTWSRRQPYALGFGPLPIILSTNLFLWFKDEWFIFQFALIALGFLGKAYVRWERDGRRVHIFNPSAFTLAIFSLALLVTGATDLTWGPEIATTQGLPPRIYLVLFSVGLVVMYFFAITPVTAGAAATLFGASALYFAITGVPYFVDSEIPAAVFLGLHLLVTDPSTSPRTPFGRLIFGVLYGGGVFVLYSLLGALGQPTFYDKLLCVPLLNLSVPAIDRFVRAIGTQPLIAYARLDGPLGRGNLAHIGVWILLFAVMTARGATTLATRCRSGSRRAVRAGRARASGWSTSKRRTAGTTRAGHVTSSGATTPKGDWSPPTWSLPISTSRAAVRRASRRPASTCSIPSQREAPIRACSISVCS